MPSSSILFVFLFCWFASDSGFQVGGFQHVVSTSTARLITLTRDSSPTKMWMSDFQQEKEEPKIDFAFRATSPTPIIPVTATDDDAEASARRHDEPMFTASVRRDLYNIMRNPFQPHIGAPAPLSWWGSEDSEFDESSQFGAVLLGKRIDTAKDTGDASSVKDIHCWDTYAFTDRMTYDPSSPACEGFTALDDEQVLSAISVMGLSSKPHFIAITKAFEAWLTQLAASHWGDFEASKLSVEFLIAFGNEITDRLGVNHRILSSDLSQEEMKILSEPPFVQYILPELLQDFQLAEVEVDEEQSGETASVLWWDYEDGELPEY